MLLGVGGERQGVRAGGVLLGAEHEVGVALGGKLVVAPLLVGSGLVLVGLGLHGHVGQRQRPHVLVVGALRHGLRHRPVVGLVVGPAAGEVADDVHRLDLHGLGNLLLCNKLKNVFLDVNHERQRVLTSLLNSILHVALGGKLIVAPFLVGRSLVLVSLSLQLHVGQCQCPHVGVGGAFCHGLSHRPVAFIGGPAASEVADDVHRLNNDGFWNIIRCHRQAVVNCKAVPLPLCNCVKQIVSSGGRQVARLVPLVIPRILGSSRIHSTDNHARLSIVECCLINTFGTFHRHKICPCFAGAKHVKCEPRTGFLPVGTGLEENRLTGIGSHQYAKNQQ